MSKQRVVVAMSGGVDSSVAAGLLVEQGYEVIGITMRLWTEDDASAARHHKRCCSVEDTDDARAAADALGVRHYVLNLEREFAENVVDHFVAEYTRGRTPNPCLSCNDKVKFRPLFDHAVALGADYLATGHYARTRSVTESVARGPSPDRTTPAMETHLLTGIDPSTSVARGPSPDRTTPATETHLLTGINPSTSVARGPSPDRTTPATTHLLTGIDPSTSVARGPSPDRTTPAMETHLLTGIDPSTSVARGPSPDRTTPAMETHLLTGIDPSKDQSYVLYTLKQPELQRTLFPVGEFPKHEIRRMARAWNLPNAEKPDSADICFIPSGDYRAFVRERVPVNAGDIVDTAGTRVGEHEGIVNYTVGQRRGVPARGNAEPLFVVDIDPDSNRVVVGAHSDLMAPSLIAEGLTFVSGDIPRNDTRVEARIRYRAPAVPATLRTPSGGAIAEVLFDEPQRAVTPGQAVVFYDGERVLGGGTIVRRLQ